MFSGKTISPLFTDFYELTMMAGYHKSNINHQSTFSVHLRPSKKRNYFVASGLKSIIHYIENLKFTDEDIKYLKSLNSFEPSFLDWLENFKFSGDIHAMEEGTVFFGNEPIMEISAPIMEAQLLETMIVNTINLETMIATKAARCVYSAQGRPVVDFSLRRTQGTDAGIKVARSSYIAGFEGTSNVFAAKLFGIPVSGTMAHSFVTAFENEEESFRAFADLFPENCVLLIDTFNVIKGAEKAALIGKEMEKQGKKIIGVRLDSGDMTKLSKEVRKILDNCGLSYAKIFASGGFDEYKIKKVLAHGARIDAFGVGTRMGVSSDAPYHDTVFKLCRFNKKNVRKLSKDKVTLAGEKQVFRFFDENGKMKKDIISARNESFENGTPLLTQVFKNGKKCRELKKINQIKKDFQKNFTKLDNSLKSIDKDIKYPDFLSEKLKALQI